VYGDIGVGGVVLVVVVVGYWGLGVGVSRVCVPCGELDPVTAPTAVVGI